LIEITRGGAFLLTTSRRAMKHLYEQLAERLAHDDLMVQGESPKNVLLDRFRLAAQGVLVATMSFWEGVDVPGQALRLVIMDKIPFAVPTDPIMRARAARIEEAGGNPFMELYVPQANITLKQGFGRLIRRRSDVGIVALLDVRARQRGYGRRLLAGLPPAQRTDDLAQVEEFWRSHHPALDMPGAGSVVEPAAR
jgi:ATP-dependent DNA helicase DinG